MKTIKLVGRSMFGTPLELLWVLVCLGIFAWGMTGCGDDMPPLPTCAGVVTVQFCPGETFTEGGVIQRTCQDIAKQPVFGCQFEEIHALNGCEKATAICVESCQ